LNFKDAQSIAAGACQNMLGLRDVFSYAETIAYAGTKGAGKLIFEGTNTFRPYDPDKGAKETNSNVIFHLVNTKASLETVRREAESNKTK
jgi:hypothetical protein